MLSLADSYQISMEQVIMKFFTRNLPFFFFFNRFASKPHPSMFLHAEYDSRTEIFLGEH